MDVEVEKETPDLWFDQLVLYAAKKRASDIFINADTPVAIKQDGKVKILPTLKLNSDKIYKLLRNIALPEAYDGFLKTHELNFMVERDGVDFLRVNAYMQKNIPGIVIRLISSRVPSLESLQLPAIEHLKKIALARNGLVLVTGATGAGKSSTLAAMIDYRNHQTGSHIISVEDPIEFTHRSKKSVVIQREIGIDTDSFATALKNSLREAPDVILIGEIRDELTMDYALQFAETGHLVLATLHATNTIQALERVYNFFPQEQRDKLQKRLAASIGAILSQQLLPTHQEGGRIVAMEMLKNTPFARESIELGKMERISDLLNQGDEQQGFFSFDQNIFELYEAEKINYEVAIQFVNSPHNFQLRVRSESRRELPEILRGNTDNYSVQTRENLEEELLRTEINIRKSMQTRSILL